MLPLIETLRPKQWTKNLLLLLPLVFSQRLLDLHALGRAWGAFFLFCLLSGAVYIINDLQDLELDRLHPKKSKRPLASGRLAPGTAKAVAVLLIGVALAAAWWLSPGFSSQWPASYLGPGETRSQPTFFACALAYLGLQLGYSMVLKNVVILDVMMIAMGFVLRAVAGAAAIPVDISHWLLICTIFLSLFLALAKRRHEILLLADSAAGHRPILREYDLELLDQLIVVAASASVISYALYTMAPETASKFHTDRLNITIPFVVYGLFRYLYLIHRRDDGGDPSASLLTDRPILAAVAFWGLTVVAILYR